MSLNKAYVASTQVASSTPFDDTTGHGFNTPSGETDVQAALEGLRDHTIFVSNTHATSVGGTLTLTSADTTLQFITGTATGYSIVLPNATTLTIGQHYKIDNLSSNPVTVKDGSGATLFILGQSSIGDLTLQLNGTSAGSWVWWQTSTNVASGIIVYNITSNTAFSSSASVDTLITGMSVVPAAGTYSIWYNAENSGTGSGQQLDVTIYNGASPITDSVRSNLSTAGTHIFQSSTQTTSQFDGVAACSIKVNANGNSMTVGARSLLMIRTGV